MPIKVVSEGPIRITKSSIDAAWRRRAPGTRLIIRDSGCRGLHLIINPTAMTWSFAYRPRGTDAHTGRRWPNRTLTLGSPASHSVDDARAEANRIKGQIAAGADPVADRKARADADRKKRSATLGRLLQSYSEALPLRPKMRGAGVPSPAYVSGELAQVRLALNEMGVTDTSVVDLGAADLRGLLMAPGDPGSNTRARFGALARFLDWCQDTGYVQVNPCALIARSRRPRPPQARAHYLTLEELARLWHAADSLREPVGRDLARFLIAVPCRRGEAARLEWPHVDLAAAEWRQPGLLTKNRDPHRLHLHSLALRLLRERYEAVGQPKVGLAFPAPVSESVVDTFSDLKAALADLSGIVGWTWHDFRRSFATALGEAGIPEVVADAVLNHRQSATRGGVLGVYQRASRWPEQVRAMELWGRLLTASLGESEIDAEVVPLPRAG
ncbi:MAG: site-specific integrase [Acetobacteraceae bacterium]|nr:site-specific integrase [Acetobacteraceae bacterium]